MWKKITGKLNKTEQAQVRKLVDALNTDLVLFEKVIKHYFNNFNKFRGKFVIPNPGQVLYLHKEIQADMLNLTPRKNDGEYDGNSATKMAAFYE